MVPVPNLNRWSFYTLKHYRAQYNCDPQSDLSLKGAVAGAAVGVVVETVLYNKDSTSSRFSLLEALPFFTSSKFFMNVKDILFLVGQMFCRSISLITIHS